MATLTNTKIKDTYDGLLKTTNNEAIAASGVTLIEDGLGNASALSVGRSGNGVTITGNLAVDTNTLYVDASNNRVGVGTDSPEVLFQADLGASGNIAQFEGNSNIHLRIGESSGNMYLNANNGNATIEFQTNGSERMRIDSSGRVGIGTSSPESTLHISTNSSVNQFILERTGTSTGKFKFLTLNNTLVIRNEALASDNLIIDSSGTVSFAASSALSSAVASIGHLSSNGYMYIKGGTGGLILGDDSTASRIQIEDNSNIRFETAGSEAMRITSAGDVLFGSAESNSSVSTSTGLKLFNSNSSTAGRIDFRKTYSGATNVTANYHAGTYVGGIVASNTATSFDTASDYRLKEDLQPIDNPLDRVDSLNPINFAWKADGSRVDGFIAHEVQDIVPEAVTGEKDAVDEEGNPVYQGIDQSKLVPLLVGAIQELRAEIELLKNK